MRTYFLSVGCLLDEVGPLLVEDAEALLGGVCIVRPFAALDELAAGVVERVHAGLVRLDVVDEHLELGELDLDHVRVAEHRLQFV